MNLPDDRLSPGPSHSVPRSSSSPAPPRRSKEFLSSSSVKRVTFQQKYSNSVPKTRPFCRTSKQNASPSLWRNEQQSVLTPAWSMPEIRSLYLESEPTEGTNKPWDMNLRDVVLSRMTMNHPLAETDRGLKSHTGTLLRLTQGTKVLFSFYSNFRENLLNDIIKCLLNVFNSNINFPNVSI